ncbi:protealysin inhibitor emfourin [Quadrisphaera sp. DSM 44207]|uniref:protealysin inhibitor emfourin n=1 Tax=Quadrisphaera sp. DSM 44207 TaxID=1881057 RepID=UPI0008879DBD|nr:protealysin inhibitor emfourin [Quadrisphaera sp. DSM 44207]SDQ13058.1 hypothetical protein SAMN05428996_0697 [Quadrisphaera sp. DSM 44207]
MRIAVSRSGGVAGLVRRAEVDTDAREDADAWLSLADRAVPLPEPPDGGPVRDAFVWTIELGDQRAVLPDRSLTGPLRTLAERALAEGRRPG